MSKIRFMMIEADGLSDQTLGELVKVIAGALVGNETPALPPSPGTPGEGRGEGFPSPAPAAAALPPVPRKTNAAAAPVRHTHRPPATALTCDQHPEWGALSTKHAAEKAGASPAGVSLAVKHERPIRGLRFRRAPKGAAGNADDSEGEPAPAPAPPPQPREFVQRLDAPVIKPPPKPAKPKPEGGFANNASTFIPHYDLAGARTRGEADAELMPVNPGFHRPRDPEPARPVRFAKKEQTAP